MARPAVINYNAPNVCECKERVSGRSTCIPCDTMYAI